MTKEDKQIIKRAVKEEWRIGDRSRLKRLLEKNLELYRENVELENKIADIKANCDLAIEGRDVKIKELEQQIEKLIDFVLSKTECCDVCPITDTCINSEGTCPYAGILAKGEEEVTREWLMQFISRR
jgi:hypothetical protein